MKSVVVLAIVSAIVSAVHPLALAGDLDCSIGIGFSGETDRLTRIDDRTLLDESTGRFAHLPPTMREIGTLRSTPNSAPGTPLTLNDGYVGCSTTDDCWAFDLDTHVNGANLNLLPEGNYPYDATMSIDGAEVWIPGASGDAVVVIDRATDMITHRIATGDYSISVVFTDDSERALVSNRGTRDITIISTATYSVIGTLDLGLTTGMGPGNMALDPVSGKIYAVRWYDGELFEISADGSQLLDTRSIGDSLWQLVVSPAGQFAFVTDRGTDEVLVVELATLTVVDRFAVGDDPWGLDITADGQYLVAACEDAGSAYVIHTGTSDITPILLAGDADPRDVDILNADGLAFVTGGRVGTTDPVYVIDIAAGTVSTSFDMGGTNTNVIAVEPQMHSTGPSAVGEPVSTSPRWAALQSYPNPFNPSTMIDFSIPDAAQVRLGVFDESGRLVTLLVDAHRAAGQHRVRWDGRDQRGRTAPGGVYFVRLDASGVRQTTKIALVK